MGVTIKVFIVETDDRLRRLPVKQFDRLRRNDPKTTFPEYADQKVRYILVGIALENRKPNEIILTDYGYLCFDKNGRFDKEFRTRERRAFVDSISLLNGSHRESPETNVIQARHIFSKKRHDHEFNWNPTPEIEKAVKDAVFGEKKPAQPPLRLV